MTEKQTKQKTTKKKVKEVAGKLFDQYKSVFKNLST